MNILIALFIICTCTIVGVLAMVSYASGLAGMMYIVLGCLVGFAGGWIIIAEELS
tara:strand:+ start:348 stop:512 length:165 start_codon:yes stop_codon:yes gene_type:complete